MNVSQESPTPPGPRTVAATASITEAVTVYDGWVRLKRVTLAMPDGVEVERHIEDHGRSITVLPYDRQAGTALLVSMPRAPVIDAGEPDLLEAVAGLMVDEGPADCAIREAFEEVGVRLAELVDLGCLWSMPSQSLERIHFFLAPFGHNDRTGTGGGVVHEAENITIHECPLVDLPAMIRDGRLRDLKTVVLVQALQLREPELFLSSEQRRNEAWTAD